MRSFFLTSLAIAGLAASAVAHGGTRKSLGFGPVHPSAGLRTVAPVSSSAFFRAEDRDVDPMHVAREFMRGMVPDGGYVIRDDSYTDKATGVTHVYVRQLVDGVEVADGDMNLNVKDGVVMSYGDSFYRGPAPEFKDMGLDPHAEFCDSLRTHYLGQLLQLSSSSQTPMGSEEAADALHPLPHLHDSNCNRRSSRLRDDSRFAKHSTPEAVLLRFMVDATPSEEMAADIIANFEEHLGKMTTEMDSNVAPGGLPQYQLINNVPDAVSPVKVKPVFVQVNKGDETVLQPAYKFEVEMRDNWYEAHVSVHEPHNIISVVDWASDAYVPRPNQKKSKGPTYNVFTWGINDPSEGKRSVETPEIDTLASPAGWHALPVANDPKYFNVRTANKDEWHNTITTWGNNVFAHEDWEGRNNYIDNYRPDAGKDLNFDFKYKPKETDSSDALEEAKKYINATVTQLFYTSNMVHDLYYRYGFDEVSGNFQQHNFGRGGRENDGVIANAQDGSGYNNANFMTPPDGQNGRCRMYLWNTATPYRDGDLEAGIVIHELSHGLSTRLTGGPMNSGCLGWGESGGMGEGWGDFIATTIRSTSNYSDYSMGEWAANRVGGIRNFVYSLDETVNPSTYKTLDKPGYWGVHAIGEVWAEILWVVSNDLIKKYGFSDSLFPPQPEADGAIPTGDFYRAPEYTAAGKPKPLVPKHGNTLMLQLVFNGMKLQPCRPTFFDARDAIIQADEVLTGGENFCDLWIGFAKRGLGPDARVEGRTPWGGGVRTNDYEVPKACKDYSKP